MIVSRVVLLCSTLLILACEDGTDPTPEPPPDPVPNGAIVWASPIDDPQGWRTQIYSVQGDGTNLRQLTSEFATRTVFGSFGAPRVSFMQFDAQATPQQTYYTMRPDGTSLVGPFTFDFYIYDVTPDGSRGAGQSETLEPWIGVANLLTGETTHLSTAPLLPYDVFWAPTGDVIGFTGRVHDDSTSDIYTIRADGTGLTRLTNDPAYEDHVRWSPDGKHIVYVRSIPGQPATLSVIDADGSNLKDIYHRVCELPVAWSPDGSQVLCTITNGPTEALIDVETGVAHPTGFSFYCLGWSPDGTRLLCVDDNGVYSANPDGSEKVTVAPSTGGIGFAIWLRADEP